MSIDPSIAIRAGNAGTVNLSDMYRQRQQMQMQQQQMDMQRQRIDLDREMQAYKMDAEKREALKEGVKDMHAAVRWADTPEKWAQVQQHYGKMDPQIASIPYEQRETALVQLGQLDEYLKATQEKFQSIEAGGSLYGIKPDGQVREVVRANPGDQQFGQPAAQGGKSVVRRGKDATGRTVVQYSDGSIDYEGGAASNGGGNFP